MFNLYYIGTGHFKPPGSSGLAVMW